MQAGAGEDAVPWSEHSWWRVITFSYVSGLLKRVHEGEEVELRELPSQKPADSAQRCLEDFQRKWSAREVRSSRAAMGAALRREQARAFFAKLARQLLLVFATVFLFGAFADFMLDPSQARAAGYVWAGSIALAAALMAVVQPMAAHFGTLLGLKGKAMVICAAWDKVTRSADNSRSLALATNLMANDSQAVYEELHNWSNGTTCPLALLGFSVALGFLIGAPCLVMVAILVLSSVALLLVSKKVGQARSDTLRSTDSRVHLLSELLSCMMAVKIYVWEQQLRSRVAHLRDTELGHVFRTGVFQMLTLGSVLLAQTGIVVVTLSVFLSAAPSFSSATMLKSLAIFTQIWMPFAMLGIYISRRGEASPGYSRLDMLLEGAADTFRPTDAHEGSAHVSMRGCEIVRGEDFRLQAERLDLEAGTLTMVFGAIGSGKSLFLRMLAGLLLPDAGDLKRLGSVSFMGDRRFIFSDTLCNNVLAGLPLDEARLKRALELACLTNELGESTMMRERGANLSGGQKTRVCLARALYAGRSIVVLDDPLSSLDAKVALQVLRNLLQVAAEGTMVVISNHQPQYARFAHQVLTITAHGKIVAGMDEFLSVYGESGSEFHGDYVGKADSATGPTREETSGPDAEAQMGAAQLWSCYLRESSVVRVGACLLLFALSTGSRVLVDLWLVWFISVGSVLSGLPVATFCGSWLGVMALDAVLFFCSRMFLLRSTVDASRSLFSKVVILLFKASMRFFDETPVGDTLNTLGGDTAMLDQVTLSLNHFLQLSMQAVATVVLAAVSSVWFLLLIPVVLLGAFWSFVRFRTGARTGRFLESRTRAPLYSLVADCIEGYDDLRVYGELDSFRASFFLRADEHIQSSLAYYTFLWWFNLRVDMVSALVTAGATFLSIETRSNPALGLLSVIYAMGLTNALLYSFQHFSTAESQLVSAGRLAALGERAGASEELCGADRVDPECFRGWPARGRVEFRHVCFRYSPSGPLVLDDVSFDWGAGELAIVGRTGAGKSSILMALFRLYEIESGEILVDGIDTRSVPLAVLRRSISYLPQHSVLFSGSIRDNLEILSEHPDDRLRGALREVGLPHMALEQSAANISAGEKQNLCVARLLLNPQRILVLDEVAAALSVSAEDRVTRLLSRKCATTISIVHHLRTTVRCHHVLVLRTGRVVEAGSPVELSERKDSLFSDMTAAIGMTGREFAALAPQAIQRTDASVDEIESQFERFFKQLQV